MKLKGAFAVVVFILVMLSGCSLGNKEKKDPANSLYILMAMVSMSCTE